MSFIGGSIPTGIVVPFAGSTAPQGWLLCFGQTVNRTTYAALFAVIGTTFGVGDGSTTFGIPDLRGRSVSGVDNMGGVAANRVTNAISGITGTTLGAVGGSESLTAHTHTATGLTVSGTNSTSSVTGVIGTNTSSSVSGTTSSHQHEIRFEGSLGGGRKMYGDYNAGAGTSIYLSSFTQYNSTAASNPVVAETAGALSVSGTATAQAWSQTGSGTAAAQTWSGSVAGATASSGAGASQNMIPTIILNQIIKV